MGGSELVWVGRSLGFLLLIPGILGWGKEGHYAICKIAEGYLTEDAVAAVKELLPESAGGNLAAVCSWPDEIRFRLRWSSALHYIDTPDFKCNYEYCRDCHDSAGHKDRCVTGAIYNYTMQLASAYQNTNLKLHYNLTEALMFLSHFMGDVHQPLHVGFTGDEGGNTIVVRWFRRKSNLHHVWDDMIIDSALKTFYYSDLEIMIKAIQRNITSMSAKLLEQLRKKQKVRPKDATETPKQRAIVPLKGVGELEQDENKFDHGKVDAKEDNGVLAMEITKEQGEHKIDHVKIKMKKDVDVTTRDQFKKDFKLNNPLVVDLIIPNEFNDTRGNKDFSFLMLPKVIEELVQVSSLKNGWSDELSLWENCSHNDTVCPNPYASESISLACKFAYKNATPGSTLGDDYFLSRLPIVEKRLAQGGVRLAATLNRIFTPQLQIDDDRLLEWANAI
uniref:Aspergillus nuclease S1 n=1 Tax=Quercus lobata TaxID=97700 RepID=A0A7N2LQP7_QUELO